MDLQYILQYMYKLVYGLQHDTQRSLHKNQDKDLYIFLLYMPSY